MKKKIINIFKIDITKLLSFLVISVLIFIIVFGLIIGKRAHTCFCFDDSCSVTGEKYSSDLYWFNLKIIDRGGCNWTFKERNCDGIYKICSSTCVTDFNREHIDEDCLEYCKNYYFK